MCTNHGAGVDMHIAPTTKERCLIPSILNLVLQLNSAKVEKIKVLVKCKRFKVEKTYKCYIISGGEKMLCSILIKVMCF